MLKRTLLATGLLFTLNSLAVDVQVRIQDQDNSGFNSAKQFQDDVLPFTTLGEARRYGLNETVRAIEHGFKGDSYIIWDVVFQENAGYLAITLGPSVSEYTGGLESTALEIGRHYPSTLVSNLSGVWDGAVDSNGLPFEDALTQFGGQDDFYSFDKDSDTHHRFIATALHEAIHLLGFISGDCLGECIPQRTSLNDHVSKFKYTFDGSELIPYETLTLDEKEAVQLTQDNFLFVGSQETTEIAQSELIDGFSNGGLELHAESDAINITDGQNGSHFAPHMRPVQLMHSQGANTLDLGMAAYLLCDVGWCRNSGSVIDIATMTIAPESISPTSQFDVEIRLTGDQRKGIPNADFALNIPLELTVHNLDSPDVSCELGDNTLYCKDLSFGLSEEHSITLSLSGPEGTHRLEGGLKSNNYDVDRRPFDNLVDEFLVIATQKPVNEPDPVPMPVPPTEPASSGGPFGFGLLGILMLAGMRRLTR